MIKGDQSLFITTVLLACIGIFVLSSASVALSQKNFGNTYGYTLRQILYSLGIGFPALLLFQKIHFRFWRKISLALLIVSFFLLALVFLPKIGIAHGGAKRWLNISFFTIQPAEFLKFSLIVCFRLSMPVFLYLEANA